VRRADVISSDEGSGLRRGTDEPAGDTGSAGGGSRHSGDGRSPGVFTTEGLVAAATFCVVALAWAAYVHSTGRDLANTGALYEGIAERVLGGDVPYRDFDLEYPPLMLVPAVPVAAMTRSTDQFYAAYALVMAVVGGIGVLLVARTLVVLGRPATQRRVVLAALAVMPLAFGSVVLSRFDLLAATLVALAMLFAVTGRSRAGALALGVGVGVKLYPALLLPLLVALAWRRDGRARAAASAGIGVAAALLVFLPFVLVAPRGVADSFTYNLDRPLQLESLGASLLVAVHHVAGLGLQRVDSYGSSNLDRAGATTLVQNALLVAVVVACWATFPRSSVTAERFVRFSALALLGLVAFSKVGSPQFLLWLAFPLALQRGRRGAVAGALFAVAAVATAAYFPWRYASYVRLDDPWSTALVLTRGAALVAALAVLAWPETRRDGLVSGT
jgi:Glycosyltransferase family 87